MFNFHGANGGSWYSSFFLISSVFTFLFRLYLGMKKGYTIQSWILILVSGALFFIIGTKLLTFGSAECTTLLKDGVFPYTARTSAIFGMLFTILGIELSRSWLKIKEFMLDHPHRSAVPAGSPGTLI